jgi:sn-glycerol 3-phosphate transport system ATP-binding protein
MSAISLRNVRKRYGKNDIIHGVDLEIEAGEFIVILGPSGCGKSTLLRMIAGLEEISGGEIAIGDRVVNKLEPRERGCAMVFQNYALYPHMTVAANIGYSLKVAGVPKAERDERVQKVAQSVGLGDYLDRRPAALSGGQRQRVAMARAMVREPKVFLFDEPFSNLDAKLRVAMRAEVRRLHRQLGVTSIFVTHDQVEAMTLADRLVIMNGGHVEQVGRPADIYDRPVSRFVADFIGSPAMNLLEGTFDENGHFVHGAGGRIAVSSLNGQRVPGRKIVLGIRPESVRRTSETTEGAIPGVVDYVEELGSARLIHADVAGSRLVALDTEGRELASGTPIHLTLDDALHAFSIEDGKRIDVHAPVNKTHTGDTQ